jgi:hypothetical protein
MKCKMIDEAGLADPHAHFRNGQVGAMLSILMISWSRGEFVAAGEGLLRVMLRNSEADHAASFPSRMPWIRQASWKTFENRSSSASYMRSKYALIADAMASL